MARSSVPVLVHEIDSLLAESWVAPKDLVGDLDQLAIVVLVVLVVHADRLNVVARIAPVDQIDAVARIEPVARIENVDRMDVVAIEVLSCQACFAAPESVEGQSLDRGNFEHDLVDQNSAFRNYLDLVVERNVATDDSDGIVVAAQSHRIDVALSGNHFATLNASQVFCFWSSYSILRETWNAISFPSHSCLTLISSFCSSCSSCSISNRGLLASLCRAESRDHHLGAIRDAVRLHDLPLVFRFRHGDCGPDHPQRHSRTYKVRSWRAQKIVSSSLISSSDWDSWVLLISLKIEIALKPSQTIKVLRCKNFSGNFRTRSRF